MQSLRHAFIVLQCLGLWRPVHWLPGWKTKIYNSYTWLMSFLMITESISQFVELFKSINDVAAFANNSFLLLSFIAACGKGANMLQKRYEIINLTKVLEQDPCRPTCEEEFAIQRKFDRLVRSTYVRYGGLVVISVSSSLLRSFIDDIPGRSLPFNSWLPFDYSDSLFDYSIIYSHQIVTLVAGAAVHVVFDCLVVGFMLQTCAQLNILKHRFHKIPELLPNKDYDSLERNKSTVGLERTLLSEGVRHHLEILKFAETSNDVIKTMLFLQYAVSTLVLCVSVIEISGTSPFSAAFVAQVMYFSGMLVQIFIFCLYGGEVTFQSQNFGVAIYDMNWTMLSLRSKRSLLVIMARSQRPIEFTTANLITVNVESFNRLLKLSYSTYNLMQQTSR